MIVPELGIEPLLDSLAPQNQRSSAASSSADLSPHLRARRDGHAVRRGRSGTLYFTLLTSKVLLLYHRSMSALETGQETKTLTVGVRGRPPTTESATAARAQRTRERILQAAMACYREVGVRDATLASIAARADSTKPTVYAHFGSKDGLFDAVVIAVTAELGTEPWTPFDPKRSLHHQLVDLLARHLDLVLERDNLTLCRAIQIEYTRRSDLGDWRHQSYWRKGPLREWLEKALASRPVSTDIEEAATTLGTMTMGRLYWPFLFGGLPVPNRAARRREIAAMVRFFLRGMGLAEDNS